jgi:hypothetical protein
LDRSSPGRRLWRRRHCCHRAVDADARLGQLGVRGPGPGQLGVKQGPARWMNRTSSGESAPSSRPLPPLEEVGWAACLVRTSPLIVSSSPNSVVTSTDVTVCVAAQGSAGVGRSGSRPSANIGSALPSSTNAGGVLATPDDESWPSPRERHDAPRLGSTARLDASRDQGPVLVEDRLHVRGRPAGRVGRIPGGSHINAGAMRMRVRTVEICRRWAAGLAD